MRTAVIVTAGLLLATIAQAQTNEVTPVMVGSRQYTKAEWEALASSGSIVRLQCIDIGSNAPISLLVERLNKDGGDWRNGICNPACLPSNATPESVVAAVVSNSVEHRQTTNLVILQTGEVQIKLSGGSETYWASLIQLDSITNILLFRFESDGWWNRFYDVPVPPSTSTNPATVILPPALTPEQAVVAANRLVEVKIPTWGRSIHVSWQSEHNRYLVLYATPEEERIMVGDRGVFVKTNGAALFMPQL